VTQWPVTITVCITASACTRRQTQQGCIHLPSDKEFPWHTFQSPQFMIGCVRRDVSMAARPALRTLLIVRKSVSGRFVLSELSKSNR
jgi:hypothetical protein